MGFTINSFTPKDNPKKYQFSQQKQIREFTTGEKY